MRTLRITVLIIVMAAFGSAGSRSFAGTMPSVFGMKCEYKTNPIGIDVTKPRLSWKMSSSQRAVRQAVYQIRAAGSVDELTAGKNLLWDSGKVDSEESVHVVYGGKICLLYTSPSPRDLSTSRMPSSA